MKATVKSTGLGNLTRKLKRLSSEEIAKVSASVLFNEARKMADAVQERAPVDTGRLKKAVIVSKVDQRRGNNNRNYIHYRVVVNRGSKRSDAEGAYYAKWVEEGHKTGKPTSRWKSGGVNYRVYEYGTSEVPAHPFFWPTIDSMKGGAVNRIKQGLTERVKAIGDK